MASGWTGNLVLRPDYQICNCKENQMSMTGLSDLSVGIAGDGLASAASIVCAALVSAAVFPRGGLFRRSLYARFCYPSNSPLWVEFFLRNNNLLLYRAMYR
jgi:hypothetical protein